jgi:hypothetical protein
MQKCDKVEERFYELEQWLLQRLAWIDSNIKTCC